LAGSHEPSRDPEAKPSGRVKLEPRSFADLLNDVAPGFVSQISDGGALAKLIDKTELSSEEQTAFRLVRSPNDLSAPEGVETEIVEPGAACSALHSTWLTDSLWLPLKLVDIANTIRYGVNPVDRSELKRTAAAELPAWSGLGYLEASTSSWFEGKSNDAVYIGGNGDLLVVGYEDSDVADAVEDAQESDKLQRCVLAFETKRRQMKLACSSRRPSSVSETPTLVADDTLETNDYVKGASRFGYDRTYKYGADSDVSRILNEQSGADKITFTHDFRGGTTRADSGWFGIFYSPYAYAAGELALSHPENGSSATCTVSSVRFTP
jgi:hypothetical protein